MWLRGQLGNVGQTVMPGPVEGQAQNACSVNVEKEDDRGQVTTRR